MAISEEMKQELESIVESAEQIKAMLKEQDKVDVILAMYHDQGLPVIKTMGFGTVTNISLGLPFIRTSVDHGTAYDLAGSIEVDESSLIEAAKVAAKLSRS